VKTTFSSRETPGQRCVSIFDVLEAMVVDQSKDIGLQVSRPRQRPGQNELECTRVSRPYGLEVTTLHILRVFVVRLSRSCTCRDVEILLHRALSARKALGDAKWESLAKRRLGRVVDENCVLFYTVNTNRSFANSLNCVNS